MISCLPALGQDANVVIHEATNTFLKGIDKDTSFKATSRDAKIHGHSTPIMVSYYLFTIIDTCVYGISISLLLHVH